MFSFRPPWFSIPAGRLYTVKKKMKCSEDFEILHEIVSDTTRKSEKHEIICELSQTISYSISESPLHFISFLRV